MRFLIRGPGGEICMGMRDGKLAFDGKEIALDTQLITLGRSTDNTIAFPTDSNVSRYHAEIEFRHGEYLLIDLGSSNGTSLNGQKITEAKLGDGDTILLGGSSEIKVSSGDQASKEAEDSLDPADDGEFSAGSSAGIPSFGSGGGGGSILSNFGGGSASGAAGAAGGTGGAAAAAAPAASNPTLLVAGVVGGLALVCVVAVGAIYLTRGSGCHGRAVVTKPEAGDTISQPVDVEVESQDTECVAAAVFTIDGNEIARAEEQPFSAKLDPKEFPELADGFEHNLQIVLIDSNGEKIPQPESVQLAFETRQIVKVDPSPEPSTGTPTGPQGPKKGTPTLLDIRDMSAKLLKAYPASANYSASNQQLLAAIQKATADYAKDGYFQRASAYRDVINVAYVQEQNLDAGLGFTLAMSRSNFNPAKQGSDEGLWRMSNEFATANGYNGQCVAQSLADPSQTCAAKASALYMKALVFGVFDGDFIYSVAAFGKSPADAGAWKAALPVNRSDLWNSIKGQQERDQLVRFLAAGIVAENPQKFGLTKDRPLSELYRVTQ